jgi:hypothetical protein
MKQNVMRARYPSIFVSAVVITLVGVSLFEIMRHGAQVQAAADAQRAQHLEQEGGDFCREFIRPSEPELLANCVARFLQTMKRFEGKFLERTNGIL